MVALGAFMSCIAVGAMFSLPVFLEEHRGDRLVVYVRVRLNDARLLRRGS